MTIDLDFPTVDAAEAFLRSCAPPWSDPQRSPALAGAPSTRIFETAG